MVHALETSLQALLEGSKQYQVPLYQRTYSWQQQQLAQLWDDVLKLAADRVEDRSATHFIGSLVLAPSPDNGPAGVSQYLVVRWHVYDLERAAAPVELRPLLLDPS